MMKFLKHPIIINILLIIIATILVVFGTLAWLKHYTLHNQAVIIPDLKGKQVEEVKFELDRINLRIAVIDSVYSKEVAPGAIVEVFPKSGSKVKDGRIIYLTVNAKGAQTAIVPKIEDLSFRQALATLTAQGFENIEVKEIPGIYKDLALGLEAYGRALLPGDKISLSTKITLIICNGEKDVLLEDSLGEEGKEQKPLEIIESEDEKWM